jgi:NAD(P)-dependent dehydrogenase (short-subunit alcohol dehydrogenase family)
VLIRPKSDLATLTNEVAGGTFAGKRMLVTGGAGFLGSWLCDFLIEAKALVDCVDDQLVPQFTMNASPMGNLARKRGKMR